MDRYVRFWVPCTTEGCEEYEECKACLKCSSAGYCTEHGFAMHLARSGIADFTLCRPCQERTALGTRHGREIEALKDEIEVLKAKVDKLLQSRAYE